MKLLFLMICCLLILPAIGQQVLKGRVIDEQNKPVPGASVFLNNSSLGTTADEQGYFQLKVPAGRYDLIISSVGFETYSLPVHIAQDNGALTIRMTGKVKELEDVRVEPYEKDGWEKWGRFFMEHFIGNSALAKQCVLKNSSVIRFRNSKKNNELTAHALAPLVIENRALGYVLTYQLETFRFNFKTRLLFYQGYPFFKNMPGNAARQNKWNTKRAEVYAGSMLHFMRSVYRNRLVEEGFEIKRIRRIPNRQPLPPGTKAQDSAMMVKASGSPEYKDLLYPQVLPGDSIAYAADSTTAGLFFEDYLQVTYTLKDPPDEYKRKIFDSGSTFTSRLTLINNQPISIQSNGTYYEPTNLLISGYWSWSEKIATMLPFDYIVEKR